MKKIIIAVILCLALFCYALAQKTPDSIKSTPLDAKHVILPGLEDFMEQFGGGQSPSPAGDILKQMPEMNNLLKQIQNAGNLIEQSHEEAPVSAFSIPRELVEILPPGDPLLSNNNCFINQIYAIVGFDASVNTNDGNGYSFTFSINTLNPDIQNEEAMALREILEMSLNNDMMSIRKREHPKTGDKLSETRIKPWGGGGSFQWIAEWDGEDRTRYSCYYTGKVNDVFFTLKIDGENIVVPEQVADKLAKIAGGFLTYKSLKARTQN
jgi:hypothetical protein